MPPGLDTPIDRAAQDAAVHRAWRRYLETTRVASPDEYDAAEELAWLRLTHKLAALGAPVEPPAEAGLPPQGTEYVAVTE